MTHRITVRLDDPIFNQLEEKRLHLNGDISSVIRQALQAYLDNRTQPQEANEPTLIAPEEVGSRIPQYLSWKADLRDEVK